MKDDIDEALGLPALPTTTSSTELRRTVRDARTAVIQQNEESDAVTDIEHARQNLYEVGDVATEAIAEMFRNAKQSGDWKDWDALSKMLKVKIDSSSSLVDVQKKKKEILQDQPEGPHTINQNLYVTTEDVIRELAKQDGDDE